VVVGPDGSPDRAVVDVPAVVSVRFVVRIVFGVQCSVFGPAPPTPTDRWVRCGTSRSGASDGGPLPRCGTLHRPLTDCGGRSAHTELHAWKTGPLCLLERHDASTILQVQSACFHQRWGESLLERHHMLWFRVVVPRPSPAVSPVLAPLVPRASTVPTAGIGVSDVRERADACAGRTRVGRPLVPPDAFRATSTPHYDANSGHPGMCDRSCRGTEGPRRSHRGRRPLLGGRSGP
jgi:hypothetical protein